MSISRVAAAPGVSWDTANGAVLEHAKNTLLKDPDRLKGVEVIGVDGHVWRHTRKGDRYVTVNCTGFDGGSEYTEGSLS
ncbi:hypothetical protein [Actinomyces ruminis]|uniref:hypothetical protein n=1 Tax=Actinomyces ruminis TaxID=1937003 RepID=UPI001177AED1|nr:hypothetical protein [Actinomyces ruminis]